MVMASVPRIKEDGDEVAGRQNKENCQFPDLHP